MPFQEMIAALQKGYWYFHFGIAFLERILPKLLFAC
jgi:hypothetical protein